MIRVEIIDSSPVFLLGLVQVLSDSGIRVLAARTSPGDAMSWPADAVLVDPDAVPDSATEYIAERARSAAVLVMCVGPGDPDAERFLSAGAAGVFSKTEPGDVLVRAVRSITTPAGWPEREPANRPGIDAPRSAEQ